MSWNDHIIVRAHIPQKSYGTTFIKFHELFCDLGFCPVITHGQFILNKNISRDAGDMFFNKRVPVNQEIDTVRGKYMFKFKTIDAGGIRFFHIKIGKTVVEDIPDLYAERFGISEGTVVNS